MAPYMPDSGSVIPGWRQRSIKEGVGPAEKVGHLNLQNSLLQLRKQM
jgi:hypothetical protein